VVETELISSHKSREASWKKAMEWRSKTVEMEPSIPTDTDVKADQGKHKGVRG